MLKIIIKLKEEINQPTFIILLQFLELLKKAAIVGKKFGCCYGLVFSQFRNSILTRNRLRDTECTK